MRVILSALGSMGDIFPMLGFGRALARAGHSVVFVTSGNFRSDVADAGLEYAELFDAETYETCTRAIEEAKVRRRKPANLEVIESIPRRLYDRIEAHHVPGETVSASLPWFTLGATQAAKDRLGVPKVYVWVNVRDFRRVQPFLPTPLRGVGDLLRNTLSRIFLRSLRRGIDELRCELGLPRQRNFMRAWWHTPDLNVTLFPSWFVPWFRGKIPNTVLTGFPLYQGRQADRLPETLATFLDRGAPPVVFANASWRSGLKDFAEASASTCRALGLRGVLVTAERLELSREDDSFISTGYVPLKLLLPRSAAIVHHCGLGTLASALACGVPQLGVPWTGDHPHNARYLERLGVGLSVPARQYECDAMPILRRLLGSPAIHSSCRQIAERFTVPTDYGEAIERLERLPG